MWLLLSLVAAGGALGGPRLESGPVPEHQLSDPYYEAARAALAADLERPLQQGAAKNVILFVGDGMSLATITAARILDGQLAGGPGEENVLSFESFPFSGLVKTYNTDRQSPDSAGTMTAIMTGVKTRAGIVGLSEAARRGRCAELEAHWLVTALELAERAGMSTGVVTTARITHATPAAAYAHSPDRGWEGDADLGEKARSAGCTDIASQLVHFPFGDGLEVALGGGRINFLPRQTRNAGSPAHRGRRKDGRDLTREWLNRSPAARYVTRRSELMEVDAAETRHLLGLFSSSHMAYELDRRRADSEEPSLVEMVQRALDLVSRNPKGFLLVVESGRIDHAHHAGNAQRALVEAIELSRAVQLAMDRTREHDTLIVVTADHGHGISIGGRNVPRGNPVLGLVKDDVDLSGLPYTVLSYATGPGLGKLHATPRVGQNRVDLRELDLDDPDFRQEATFPLRATAHSAEDVPVYARGPWAHLLSGTIEQNVIFHVIEHAAQLSTGGSR